MNKIKSKIHSILGSGFYFFSLSNFYTTIIQITGVGAVSIYDLVKSYADPYIIGRSIPNSLKKDGNTVGLDKFKDKYGSTPKTKSSGTFTNDKWIVL